MKEDAEGFLYPEADHNKCIHCGLCEKVCPIVNPLQSIRHSQHVVAAVSRDSKIWRASASGGAFSEICNVWGDNDTLIFGAAWHGLLVRHQSCLGAENIEPLRKSKYISSRIEDTFSEAQKHLKKGKKVIFSGTPCQIAGLRSFLRKDYDNLLLIDLICHGVGSPKVFGACVKAIEKQEGKNLTGYVFRAKRFNYETDYLTYLTFIDGTSEYVVNDQYAQLYLKQTCLRPSCGGNCVFRGKESRPGDITIADCKGLTSIFPQFTGTKRNYSTIVSNTKKGDELLSSLGTRMKVFEYGLDDVIKYNPLFDHQTWVSEERDVFFSDFIRDMEGVIAKWTQPFVKAKRGWKAILYGWLPIPIRRMLLMILR